MGAKLLSTSNTSKAEKTIRGAAAAKFGRGKADLVFEHGQWFAIVRGRDDDRYYAVVDALPGIDYRGIDFEAL